MRHLLVYLLKRTTVVPPENPDVRIWGHGHEVTTTHLLTWCVPPLMMVLADVNFTRLAEYSMAIVYHVLELKLMTRE